MKIVSHVIVAFVAILGTAGFILFSVNKKVVPMQQDFAGRTVVSVAETVQKQIDNLSARVVAQCQGFCGTVADDRDFAMKLLVEQDFSSSEVADIAQRHMKAMGFAFLEVTDADFTILSSGHFPASAGKKAMQKSMLPENRAVCILDNTRGNEVLSLQVKVPFTCAGVKLYAFGGIEIDADFIAGLCPSETVTVFLKHGGRILGIDAITTMSEIKNHTIIINDKQWLASALSLSWAGEGESPELVVLMEKPSATSLFSLIL